MSIRLTGLIGALLLVVLLGSAQAADRETAIALLHGADALMEQKNFEKALKICERALAMDKACPAVHMKMGMCHQKSGNSPEAFKAFQEAERLARQENDPVMIRNATTAISELSKGLVNLQEADKKLLTRLLALAESALEDGHLETAHETYLLILSLCPDHGKATVGAQTAKAAIDLRGDPIQNKIAEAMLSEIWYFVGVGEKSSARTMASDLAKNYGTMSAGKEATDLLARDFKAPAKNDEKELKAQLIAAGQKAKKRSAPPKEATDPAKTAPVKTPVFVDIETVEKSSKSEISKVAATELAKTYKVAFDGGMEFYRQAKPGAEGNQQNLAKALEQFIKCEEIYFRAEKEGLIDAQMEKNQQQASMLRYACMKMTILAQN